MKVRKSGATCAGASLVDIQREEARRSAATRAAAQAAGSNTPQFQSAWAKVAAGSNATAGASFALCTHHAMFINAIHRL